MSVNGLCFKLPTRGIQDKLPTKSPVIYSTSTLQSYLPLSIQGNHVLHIGQFGPGFPWLPSLLKQGMLPPCTMGQKTINASIDSLARSNEMGEGVNGQAIPQRGYFYECCLSIGVAVETRPIAESFWPSRGAERLRGNVACLAWCIFSLRMRVFLVDWTWDWHWLISFGSSRVEQDTHPHRTELVLTIW